MVETILSIKEEILGMPHEGPGVAYKRNPVRQHLGLLGIENGDRGEAPEPPGEQERNQGAYDQGRRRTSSSMAIQLSQKRVSFHESRHEIGSGEVLLLVVVALNAAISRCSFDSQGPPFARGRLHIYFYVARGS